MRMQTGMGFWAKQRPSIAAIVIAFAGLGVSAAHANVVTGFTTQFDTDWTSAGTGMRGASGGTITVAGVTGPVNQSYLFWHGPTNSVDPNSNANVTVNANAVTGTNIGSSFDNFWGSLNSQAYRASTTAIINGNGAYALAGFNNLTNGAATSVFFNDGNAANNRDVVIFNGNDSNFAFAGPPVDPAGWDFTLNGINYTSGQAFLTLFVSDGQNFGPNDDGTLRINGTALATGGIFQGNTLPGPSVGNGNLFDIRTFDISAFLTPGVNNLHITLDAGFSDALNAVAAFVDLPAGAAPSIPEPGTLALFSLAFAMVAASRRRR